MDHTVPPVDGGEVATRVIRVYGTASALSDAKIATVLSGYSDTL